MDKIGSKLHYKALIDLFVKDTKYKLNFITLPENFRVVMRYDDQGTVFVSLNNPKKLNAIDMEALKEIYSFNEMLKYSPYKVVIYIGDKNSKYFCAGGDLKYMYSLKNNLSEFWAYQNLCYFVLEKNFQLGSLGETKSMLNSKQPYKMNFVYIWNGVTMGAGLALGINSNFRIATETTNIAMPEAHFGHYSNCLFPNFANKFIPLKEALNMSLFSQTYNGYQVYEKKFATHFILNKHLRHVTGDLKDILDNYDNIHEMDKCLKFYHDLSIKEYEREIIKNKDEMENFNNRIEELFEVGNYFENSSGNVLPFEQFYHKFTENLKKSKNEPLLNKFSNRSLLTNKMNYDITLSSYDNTLTHEDRFNMEMDYAEISLAAGNIFEGIRAYFIDKDNKPNWKIKTFEELDKFKQEKDFKFKY